MENIIKERHDRLRSLVNCEPVRHESLLLELEIDNNILESLRNSVKCYILDCLFEFHKEKSFNSEVPLEKISEYYSADIMELPNRTNNGLLLPKVECCLSYNTVVKHAIRLASSLGLTQTCESAYMPLNVRLPWGHPSPEVSKRPRSSLKWHTDIWAGEWAREVILHTPIFGDFQKNGISFAEPPDEFYPDYVTDIEDYSQGQHLMKDAKIYKGIKMTLGKVYLVDSFLLHKTLSGHPSFRGILSFPLRPSQALGSDIYTNPQRSKDFIPMKEWARFGTSKMVSTKKRLEPYTEADVSTISYPDSYSLIEMS